MLPARAGMVPCWIARGHSWPRAPRARGWSRVPPRDGLPPVVLPARAGMVPTGSRSRTDQEGAPRARGRSPDTARERNLCDVLPARGDGPGCMRGVASIEWCSPARGDGPLSTSYSAMVRLCSPRAGMAPGTRPWCPWSCRAPRRGMVPSSGRARRGSPGAPRAGDGPACLAYFAIPARCSRAWGWSLDLGGLRAAGDVLRARGMVPATKVLKIRAERCSPRAGCRYQDVATTCHLWGLLLACLG